MMRRGGMRQRTLRPGITRDRSAFRLGRQQVTLGEGTRQQFLPLHLGMTAPLAEAGVVLAGKSRFRPGMEIRREGHGFHLVFYSLSGGCRLEAGGGRRRIGPGECWFLPAAAGHAYGVDRGSWHSLWFHLRAGPRWQGVGETPQALEDLSPGMEGLFDGLLYEGRNQFPDSEAAGRRYAELLVRLLRRQLGHRGASGAQLAKLERIWAEVETELEAPWNLAGIAARAGISSVHLHRVMADFYGVSPGALLRRLRMQHARELLLQTRESIGSISEAVGYECPFAFSKAFRRETGVSPTRFRARPAASELSLEEGGSRRTGRDARRSAKGQGPGRSAA